MPTHHPLACAAALVLSALPAAAQSTSPPGSLPEQTIRSTLLASPLEQVPASVTVVDGEDIRDRQWQVNLSESLSSTPGLLLQNRQNYAQDLQLSIRGHGARSTFGVRGIQIYVDDIPATMPDGQGQTNHIDLSSVERIEVLRGPYSALYGNASGGVINAYTERGHGAPRLESRFAIGSNGQKRIGLKASGETNGVGYVVSASRFLTDGYRRQSRADKNLLNARIDTQPSGDSHLMLVVNHINVDALDPGGVSPAEWLANPRAVAQGPQDFNARKSQRQTQAGLKYEKRIDAQNALQAVGYVGTRAIVQFQSTPAAAQKPPTSAGGVIDLGRNYGGLDLRWSHERSIGTSTLNVVAGLTANVVREDRKGYNNFIGSTLGVRGDLRRSESNTLSNIDPYAQASWAFAPQWALNAGLRWSNVRFVSRDEYIAPGNGDDSGNARYRRALPVVSLQHALNAATLIYAALGSGFETPTFNEISYRSGGLGGLNFGLQPAKSRSIEIGVRQHYATPTVRGDWSAALFHTRTQDEIVAAENSGGRTVFQNAGRTRRQGFELASTTWLGQQWEFNLALTLLDARVTQGYCDAKGNCVAAGNRLAGTVRSQAYLAANWHPLPGARIGIDWRHVGTIAANDSNSVYAPAYSVAALSAGYARDWGRWTLDVFARIDNLTNRRYVGSVIVNESNGRYYEAAPGRQWMAGANLAYKF